MSCNSCKKQVNVSENKPKKLDTPKTNLFLKVIFFLLVSIIVSIVILPILYVLLFKTIILNKHINMFDFIKLISNKLNNKCDCNEEEEIFEEIEEDDILEGYYEIEDNSKVINSI